MPKPLKSCPKSNESPNLVTLKVTCTSFNCNVISQVKNACVNNALLLTLRCLSLTSLSRLAALPWKFKLVVGWFVVVSSAPGSRFNALSLGSCSLLCPLKIWKNLYFISQIFSSLALLIFCSIGYAFFFLFSFNFFQQKKHFPLMRTKPKADRIKMDNYNFFNYIFNRNLLGNNPMKSL